MILGLAKSFLFESYDKSFRWGELRLDAVTGGGERNARVAGFDDSKVESHLFSILRRPRAGWSTRRHEPGRYLPIRLRKSSNRRSRRSSATPTPTRTPNTRCRRPSSRTPPPSAAYSLSNTHLTSLPPPSSLFFSLYLLFVKYLQNDLVLDQIWNFKWWWWWWFFFFFF